MEWYGVELAVAVVELLRGEAEPDDDDVEERVGESARPLVVVVAVVTAGGDETGLESLRCWV